MEANNNITKLIDIDGKSVDVSDATDRLSTSNQKMFDHFKQVNYKHIYKLLGLHCVTCDSHNILKIYNLILI